MREEEARPGKTHRGKGRRGGRDRSKVKEELRKVREERERARA
jgi:hypothetical protein